MPEESKEAEDSTAGKPAGADEQKSQTGDQADVLPEKEEKKPDQEGIDYAAELAKAQEDLKEKGKRLSQAEHTIVKLKKRKREEEELEEDLEEETEEETEEVDIDKKVKKAIDDGVKSAKKELLESEAKRIAKTYSDNPDEIELILHHYKHSLNPSGDLEADIENAYLIANRRKIRGQFSEMARLAKNADLRGKGAGESGQKQDRTVKQPTAEQRKAMERSGLKWDEKKGELISPAKLKHQQKQAEFDRQKRNW